LWRFVLSCLVLRCVALSFIFCLVLQVATYFEWQ
jgi:hypothetical protein